jgi:hypothetical protein
MLEVKYTCGTCGLTIIEKQDKAEKTIEKKELWHECSDGYVVPLQSSVDKVIVEHKKK